MKIPKLIPTLTVAPGVGRGGPLWGDEGPEMKRWRWTILNGVLGLYLAGLGFLGGIVAERIRFDTQRNVVLERFDEAVHQWHEYLMAREREALANSHRQD